MRKKLFIVTGICSTLILSLSAYGAGTGSTPKGKPFVEVQGQFVEVQGQIKSLEEQMDELVGQVESLELRVTANETAITGLEASNLVIQQKIGDLIDVSAANSTEIADALSQITDLQTQMDELKMTPDINAQAISDLDVQVGILQNFISSNTEGLLTLQDEINNNYALISAFQAQIDQINTELLTKQDVLTGQCPEGTVLVNFDGLGNIECESLNADAGIQKNTITKIFIVTGRWHRTETWDCGWWHDTAFGRHYHSQTCSQTYSGGGLGETTITCPVGSFLANGGFINDHPEAVFIRKNHSTGTIEHPGQSWIVEAGTNAGTSFNVSATADCITFLP